MKSLDVLKRVALVAVVGLALSGCTTMKGWFKGKDADAKKALEPAELVEFDPLVKVDRAWEVDLGKGERRAGVRQHPVVLDGRVYAAASAHSVVALDLQTGKQIWEYEAKKARKQELEAVEEDVPSQVESESRSGLSKEDKAARKQRLRMEKQQRKERHNLAKKRPLPRFSGGPGVGDGLVVVGALDGQVLALDATDGSRKWSAQVSNEVITAPVIAQGLVFVRSNDGRVIAFDAATGEQRWFHDQETPTLTVRGNAALVAGPGVLFVGNDDGTLTTLTMQDGRPLWQQAIGIPEGRTELERMADVDGAPVLEGTTLYATSYKNQTLAIDGPSSRVLWMRDHGGAGGVGVSSGLVVVADNAGTVWGLDKTSGAPMWSQPALARRSLSGVAIHGDYAVVGDYKGYLHWLRLSDGALAARERLGHKALVAQPLVAADGLLLVENTKGELAAYRLGN